MKLKSGEYYLNNQNEIRGPMHNNRKNLDHPFVWEDSCHERYDDDGNHSSDEWENRLTVRVITSDDDDEEGLS